MLAYFMARFRFSQDLLPVSRPEVRKAHKTSNLWDFGLLQQWQSITTSTLGGSEMVGMVGWWDGGLFISICFFGPTSIDVSLNRGGGRELLKFSPSNMRLFKVKGRFLSTLLYFLWFFVRFFSSAKTFTKTSIFS